jgi:hypothetical protein
MAEQAVRHGRRFDQSREDHAPAATTVAPLEIVVVVMPEQLAALADRVATILDQRRHSGFLDVDGAAAFLGDCSKTSIYHQVERGQIRARRLGGRLLFDPAELREDVQGDG